MKKTIALLAIAALAIVAKTQQLTPTTNAVVSLPAITWTGSNAQLIATQLLNLTNSDGSHVFPSGMPARNLSLSLHFSGTNAVWARIWPQ